MSESIESQIYWLRYEIRKLEAKIEDKEQAIRDLQAACEHQVKWGHHCRFCDAYVEATEAETE